MGGEGGLEGGDSGPPYSTHLEETVAAFHKEGTSGFTWERLGTLGYGDMGTVQ